MNTTNTKPEFGKGQARTAHGGGTAPCHWVTGPVRLAVLAAALFI